MTSSPKNTRAIARVVIVWFAVAGTVHGQTGPKNKPAKPDPRIVVTVRFSVAELDPLRPGDNYIECKVRNGSDKPIRVPSVYVGGFQDENLKLTSGGIELVHWGGKKEQAVVELNPGKEIVVFKEQLRPLLLLDPKEIKPLLPKEPRYYWSWQR